MQWKITYIIIHKRYCWYLNCKQMSPFATEHSFLWFIPVTRCFFCSHKQINQIVAVITTLIKHSPSVHAVQACTFTTSDPQVHLQKQAVRSFPKLILFEIPCCDHIFPFISILVIKLSASPSQWRGELLQWLQEEWGAGKCSSQYCKCLRLWPPLSGKQNLNWH